jgi:hypothetical protein
MTVLAKPPATAPAAKLVKTWYFLDTCEEERENKIS